MSVKKILATALVASGVLAGSQAYALTTVSTTFKVYATVTALCSLSTALDVTFDPVNFDTSAAQIKNTSVTVTCPQDQDYWLGLTTASMTTDEYGVGMMTNGLDQMQYTMWQDADATLKPFGRGSNRITAKGNTDPQNYPIYVKIDPSYQNGDNFKVAAGNYADTVTVTLEY